MLNCYPAADDFHRFQAHQFQVAYAFLADHRSELLDAVADAANQLPAIAPAGAPADLVRLHQRHRETLLGQLDGGVQAREPATDNAHIGQLLTRQRRIGQLLVGSGGVVGGCVLVTVHGWLLRLVNAGVHVRNPV